MPDGGQGERPTFRAAWWSSDADDLGVAGEVLRGVADALIELGMSEREISSILTAAGGPGARANRLLDRAAASLRAPAIALALPERIPVGAMGLVDYATHTSASLRQSMQILADYYPLLSGRSTLTLREAPPYADLVLSRSGGAAISRHWIEFSLAMMSRRIAQAVGKSFALSGVSFTHAPPSGRKLYDDFFGVRVAFGADSNHLRVEARLLDIPLRTASSMLAHRLEAKLAELRPTESDSDPFLVRVRQAVSQRLDSGDVSQAGVMAALATSRRTLQRELHRRKITHKSILDDMRRERALRLLGEGDHSIATIAELLAFSDPRAFFRAFRRWTGMSPGAARARGRRGP